ncbi:ferric reductase-like transmembrane domain-containing protein [Moritella sp. Urea-trap-13]|uniref:ferredoxin reductase family protein n=1 Tax=Moritella sp. Urea-trap-13 TaxID=2058327 RepID=UPI000C330E29|nr:ferric reductase-like transmembrane domain-containing protein [Moritella sp. Urea-trap-13]PKH09314.1 ferric reductase [Moritella sp. Urea-trap-13]
MKSIHYVLIAILTASLALWLGTEHALSTPLHFWPLRKSIIYGSGIIAIIAMSFGTLLAIRHLFSDSFLDGLDKRYKLHKWLGIAGFVAAVTHWLFIKAPKWLVDLDMLIKPIKNKNNNDETLSWFAHFFDLQRHFAKDIGEWAFYALVILIIIMLSKKITYKLARKSHKLMAIVYLVMVYHSIVLMKMADWFTPLGIFLSLALVVGSISALIALFGKIGHSKQAHGQISTLQHYTDNKVLAVTVKLATPWAGHTAGQFAFVTFDKKEGPHPFSITSNWDGSGDISFNIKQIGDYVNTLPSCLAVGDKVVVEGPYGNFNISSDKQQHIWIAGGIGIAPFLSKLDCLASQQHKPDITLYYTTNMPDDSFIQQLNERCQQAGVTVHIINTQQRRLTATEISAAINNINSTDVWFCGPAKFGNILKSHFVKQGLPQADFHQEIFDMR